ncbi:hypothetical protein D3H65_14710 [Paraflavitalea soli]|uniref:Uncharacterized protein n=1 Tax=Paraflavitalea soli TaxID=2315862 RepID=A0A3B7MPB1_9BACT|nr:hypothetical protein D3H65_14710 [Paraflavitalea soli]
MGLAGAGTAGFAGSAAVLAAAAAIGGGEAGRSGSSVTGRGFGSRPVRTIPPSTALPSPCTIAFLKSPAITTPGNSILYADIL